MVGQWGKKFAEGIHSWNECVGSIIQSSTLMTSNIISKRFKKTAIPNALDGSEDDILWNDEN